MAPRFHAVKRSLRRCLEEERDENWELCLRELEALPPKELANPLLSSLALGGRSTLRAARALGRVAARMVEENGIEEGRDLLRRLMWRMNEESGNIGWGVPEAFAEILVHQAQLANEFHHILFSYVRNTGRDDNYCDHAILRASCFRAVGQVAHARPDLATKAREALIAGLTDEDAACRTEAAEALEILARKNKPDIRS